MSTTTSDQSTILGLQMITLFQIQQSLIVSVGKELLVAYKYYLNGWGITSLCPNFCLRFA